MAFEILSDSPGLRPAPYMASRGLKWIQQYEQPGLSDDSLRDHIRASYDLVAAGLTRKARVPRSLAASEYAGKSVRKASLGACPP